MKVIVLGLLAVYAVYRIRRRIRADHETVTPSWLVDNERRQWGVGVEQSVITQWPIKRELNRRGWWNRAQCRVDQRQEQQSRRRA